MNTKTMDGGNMTKAQLEKTLALAIYDLACSETCPPGTPTDCQGDLIDCKKCWRGYIMSRAEEKE